MKHVLIVDDHPMVLEILSAVVHSVFAECEIGAATDLRQALALGRSIEYLDLVVLDLGLPGCPGISALTTFRSEFPDVRVLVVSAIEERHIVLATLANGACGYVPKTSTPQVIGAALRLIAAGGVYIPAIALGDQPGHVHIREVDSALTCRQRDVLGLITKGLSNKEIAKTLRIAQETVKQHLKAVFSTLGVSTRAQAARAAEQRGIKLE